jgi:hypothetical protein
LQSDSFLSVVACRPDFVLCTLSGCLCDLTLIVSEQELG